MAVPNNRAGKPPRRTPGQGSGKAPGRKPYQRNESSSDRKPYKGGESSSDRKPYQGGKKFSDRRQYQGSGNYSERKPYPRGGRVSERKPYRMGGGTSGRSFHQETSGISPFIKKYAGLKQEKVRLKYSQFLVEGEKIINEIISLSPDILKKVFISETFDNPQLLAQLKKNGIQIERLNEADISFLSDTQVHQGIIALAKYASVKPDWALCRYVTLLDGIQDPGNVGAIVRSSIALGMDALILGKGTCDIYNPKVVRASAGLFLHTPFEANVDLLSKISFLRTKGFTILATSSHAHYTISQVKLRRKVALIVSNEGSGISEQLIASADSIVRIPLKNKADSLNVAVAHGILANELIGGRA